MSRNNLAIPFDRVADAYDSTRGLPGEIMSRIIDNMQDALADCRSVLDIGVGTGRFANPLSERGFHVVGVDISLPMMLRANEKGLKDLVRADARSLPFKDCSFDSVLMVHLLHLVDDWVRIIHEAGRVAGSIIISLVGSASGFRVRREYLKIREDIGRPLKRLNNAEEGFRRFLQPKQVRFVGEFRTAVNSEEAITSLEKGDFAISWDLPRDIHASIINQLRSNYGAREYTRTDVYEIAMWTPEQFQGFRR